MMRWPLRARSKALRAYGTNLYGKAGGLTRSIAKIAMIASLARILGVSRIFAAIPAIVALAAILTPR